MKRRIKSEAKYQPSGEDVIFTTPAFPGNVTAWKLSPKANKNLIRQRRKGSCWIVLITRIPWDLIHQISTIYHRISFLPISNTLCIVVNFTKAINMWFLIVQSDFVIRYYACDCILLFHGVTTASFNQCSKLENREKVNECMNEWNTILDL